MNDKDKLPNLIEIGIVARPHGIRGEVKVNIFLEEGSEFFKTLKGVYLCQKNDHCQLTEIETIRIQSSKVIIKFKDSFSRNDAENLRGIQIRVPEKSLPDEEYYNEKLIGFTALSVNGDSLGEVTDILKLPYQSVYVINNAGIESLIPAVDNFIKKIDMQEGRIIIDPIDGMINQNEN